MLWKKNLCPNCKTGKDSYELDRHSEVCPYISCYNCKKKECRFYVPLETDKKSLFSKILGVFTPPENEPYAAVLGGFAYI